MSTNFTTSARVRTLHQRKDAANRVYGWNEHRDDVACAGMSPLWTATSPCNNRGLAPLPRMKPAGLDAVTGVAA